MLPTVSRCWPRLTGAPARSHKSALKGAWHSGSALPSHGRGHRFDPCRAHHFSLALRNPPAPPLRDTSAALALSLLALGLVPRVEGRPHTPCRGSTSVLHGDMVDGCTET